MMRKLIFLVFLLLSTRMVGIAQFFSPYVRVTTNTVGGQSALHFDKIKQRLSDLMKSFSPKIDCPAPSLPIDCELTLNIISAEGPQYIADVTLRMLRPIYERRERSLVIQTGERGLTFEFDPYSISLQQVAGLPEDPFLRHIYYHLLVGAWMYYDSFGDQGGTPFVEYLSAHGTEFYKQTFSIDHASSGIRPEELIPRLKEQACGLFREGYFIYHRKGIDQLSRDKEMYIEALSLTLDLLEKVKDEEPAHPLLSLFADTKLAEIRHYLGIEESPKTRAIALRLARLFPTYQQ